jgi:hypothetical protein
MGKRSEKRAILKRLDKAREATKTCPASRHVHMIVEGLLDSKDGYGADLARLGYEPEHMAGSIASVLEGLWKARQWLKWEELPPEGRIKFNGHWVPDLAEIALLSARQSEMVRHVY